MQAFATRGEFEIEGKTVLTSELFCGDAVLGHAIGFQTGSVTLVFNQPDGGRANAEIHFNDVETALAALELAAKSLRRARRSKTHCAIVTA